MGPAPYQGSGDEESDGDGGEGKEPDEQVESAARRRQEDPLAVAVDEIALDPGRTLARGEPLSLAGHRGKVVVLNFWASWCYPACYEEAPVLERNWRGYRDRGVVVVGVDIQDKREAAVKFVGDFGLTFPIAQDLKGTVSVDFGVYGVPETFFLDRQGRIRVKHVGAVTDDVFRATVDRLLAEASSP